MTIVLTRTLFTLSASALAITVCLTLFSQSALAQVTDNEVDISAEAEVQAEAELEVNAQQTARENTQADRAALSQELTASSAQQRAAVQQEMIQRKNVLEARAQERVTNLAANMSNRMEAIIERLQNIADRLESRLTKMSDSGVDITGSAAALASAQLSLDAAVLEIGDIDASVFAAVSSTNAGSSWTTLKTKFTNIKDLIKTAHSELRSSINLSKEASLAARAEQSAEVGIE